MFAMLHMLSRSVHLTQSAQRQNHSCPIRIWGRTFVCCSKPSCVCVYVNLWLCVFVFVIVRSYMKSVVPCSSCNTLFAVSILFHILVLNSDAKRHSWTPDKVLHYLVTLRFPWLELVSGLPALHVVMPHTDVPPHPSVTVCLFIDMHDLYLGPVSLMTSCFLWFPGRHPAANDCSRPSCCL